MKRLFCISLLSVFMASCTNITTPAETITPQPIVTKTPTLTLTPTLTPTLTLTPTETPDPNKPSDATGKDSKTGEYTKTVDENGVMVSYVWKQIQFGDDVENGVAGHWFESRMKDGQPIDLLGYGENCREDWGQISLNLNVYSLEDSGDLDKLGYLYHPDEPSYYKAQGYLCNTFSSEIGFDLFLRYSGLLADERESYWKFYDDPERRKKFDEKYPQSDTDRNGRMYSDWLDFVYALSQGAQINVGDQLWEPRKGYDVCFIDEAMALEDTSMYLAKLGPGTRYFYWKVMVHDGKLMAIIAPTATLKTQLSWPKKQSRESIFRFISLFPLQAVLTTPKLSEETGPFSFQEYASMAGNIISIDGQSVPQFLAFSSDP